MRPPAATGWGVTRSSWAEQTGCWAWPTGAPSRPRLRRKPVERHITVTCRSELTADASGPIATSRGWPPATRSSPPPSPSRRGPPAARAVDPVATAGVLLLVVVSAGPSLAFSVAW